MSVISFYCRGARVFQGLAVRRCDSSKGFNGITGTIRLSHREEIEVLLCVVLCCVGAW